MTEPEHNPPPNSLVVKHTERHQLPSGGWLDMTDPERMRAKDLRRITLAARVGADDGNMAVMFRVTDHLAATLFTDWKLPYPPSDTDDGQPRDWVLPRVDLAMVEELEPADYNKVRKLLEPAVKLLFPGDPDPSDYEDESSPTGPASA
jgi:hypothetical protein